MPLAESEIITRLVIAAFLGAIVGLEREVHKRPAGMRTHGLICMGAALFTIVSSELGGADDPARIASGIVTGIGFLAAGVIFKADDKVKGITTASELWVLAAVGIAIGAGLYFSGVTTIVIVLILLAPGYIVERDLEELILKKQQEITKQYYVKKDKSNEKENKSSIIGK